MSRLASRIALSLFVLLCAAMALSLIPASAQKESDEQAIEKVIRAQMAAFAKDDAATAFSYSTPGIQSLFHHDANAFIASVRNAYQPVYRPGDLYFMKLDRRGEHFVQSVKIGMPDGKVWIAHYIMRKQADKRWLIDGCQLELATEVST